MAARIARREEEARKQAAAQRQENAPQPNPRQPTREEVPENAAQHRPEPAADKSKSAQSTQPSSQHKEFEYDLYKNFKG